MQGAQRHVTRFISMADVGNKEKKKWIYAFNIVPLKCLDKSDLVAQPSVVTDMPYNESHMKVQISAKGSSINDVTSEGEGKGFQKWRFGVIFKA